MTYFFLQSRTGRKLTLNGRKKTTHFGAIGDRTARMAHVFDGVDFNDIENLQALIIDVKRRRIGSDGDFCASTFGSDATLGAGASFKNVIKSAEAAEVRARTPRLRRLTTPNLA